MCAAIPAVSGTYRWGGEGGYAYELVLAVGSIYGHLTENRYIYGIVHTRQKIMVAGSAAGVHAAVSRLCTVFNVLHYVVAPSRI